LAIGAGALFYLTVTDFIPEAEERHYQQSAALAVAAGFLVMYVLSSSF
jgi:ZIP family zinc transporter